VGKKRKGAFLGRAKFPAKCLRVEGRGRGKRSRAHSWKKKVVFPTARREGYSEKGNGLLPWEEGEGGGGNCKTGAGGKEEKGEYKLYPPGPNVSYMGKRREGEEFFFERKEGEESGSDLGVQSTNRHLLARKGKGGRGFDATPKKGEECGLKFESSQVSSAYLLKEGKKRRGRKGKREKKKKRKKKEDISLIYE